MKEPVILLTACINPKGMSYTELVDVNERKRQYVRALFFYLETTKEKIVFVENTGYDISADFSSFIADDRLEVLTFQGNDYDRSLGKGYGEALILKHAIENSKFVGECSRIVKITGRHLCLNINKVISRCQANDTVYAMLESDSAGMECDSRIFISPIKFLNNYFLPRAGELNDSKHYYFEHLLYDASREWRKDGGKLKDIWFPIEIQGQSGSTGEVYVPNIKRKITFFIHYFCHKLGYFGPIKFWNNL